MIQNRASQRKGESEDLVPLPGSIHHLADSTTDQTAWTDTLATELTAPSAIFRLLKRSSYSSQRLIASIGWSESEIVARGLSVGYHGDLSNQED